ncbi:hypothetical protein LTS18_013474, partial [Coniosporium uncinatum]
GLVQAFGAFQSYYVQNTLRDYDTSTISWIGTVESFLLVFGGIVTGPIYDQGYLRPLLFAGAFLMTLGMMMLSLADEYYQIMLAQGICVGIGSSMLYVPSLALVMGAFTKQRNIAIGLSASGGSIGGIIYPIIFQQLLPKLGFGWATRVIAFVGLFTFVVALSILARKKPVSKPPRSLFDFTALKEWPFLVFSFAIFMMFTAYWVPFFYMPLYGRLGAGATASFAFYLLSIANAASFFGRILPTVLT